MTCSGICGLTVLLVILGTGLTAAGVATSNWYEGAATGLFEGFDLDNPGDDKLIVIRACSIGALGLSLILIITYFSHCCCSESQRTCLLCTQFLLTLLAAGAAGAAVVVRAWDAGWDNADFGWSYYLSAAGAVLYVIALLTVLADFCCGRKD